MKTTRDGSDQKPKCPECHAPLPWLAQKLGGGRFCSAQCKKKYTETITRMAVERLHATLPKPADPKQDDTATVALPVNAQSTAS